LFLLKVIEAAFDQRKVCFICDPFTLVITFTVLDKTLQNQVVAGTTFGALDGQTIPFVNDVRPSFQLLSKHARSALGFAMRRGYISRENGAALLSTVAVTSPPRHGATHDDNDSSQRSASRRTDSDASEPRSVPPSRRGRGSFSISSRSTLTSERRRTGRWIV